VYHYSEQEKITGLTQSAFLPSAAFRQAQEPLIWIEANRYTIAGELREVYLRFGADNAGKLGLPPAFLADQPALYVTEVQLPIAPQRSE
jgi:hypothetical protein